MEASVRKLYGASDWALECGPAARLGPTSTLTVLDWLPASSPVLGSILTIINQERLNAGKSSIGFINPTLYVHPEIMNDITEGGNQGCGTPGFSSTPGWDPVTGLGTPNFPKMLSLWKSLP